MQIQDSRSVRERPLIGLALGGGGARGYAHLGVLKALRDASIPVDVIAGTSIGAVVGAAYAAGYQIDELVEMALHIRWRQLLSLADPTIPRQGVIAGNRLEKYFNTLTSGREFDQLEKTLIVVATDIATGEEVRIDSGPVAQALRASTALPGIFCPVKTERHLLVDGSVTTPVPAGAVMEAGAAVVLAVDVSSPVDRSEILLQAWRWWQKVPSGQTHNLLGAASLMRLLRPVLPQSVDIVGRSLELHELHDRNIKNSVPTAPSEYYWLLKPAVYDVKWYEFHRAEECIKAGEAVGRQMAALIGGSLRQRQ